MSRPLLATIAALSLLVSASVPSPAKADLWWFLTGIVVGAVVAPAYGYPYGYRSGYAPVRATAPWAESLEPPAECHWAKVQHNGAWRHARICYDSAVTVPQGQFSDTIIRK
jgi:hypothetical protein